VALCRPRTAWQDSQVFCNATGDWRRFPAKPVVVKSHDNKRHDNNAIPVAVRKPDEQETAQLRGWSFAEIHGGH
jgi:hypothetical protein